MDIGELKKVTQQADEGVTITIYQPNGEPYKAADGTDATMTVLGSESKRYKQARRAQQRRMTKRARLGAGNMSPEESEAEAIRLAASAVIAWHGWEAGGKELPCEAQHVESVLLYDHIFEQVANAITGHAGFFVSGSDNS